MFKWKKHTCAISKKNIAEAESQLIAYHLGRNQILKNLACSTRISTFFFVKKKQRRWRSTPSTSNDFGVLRFQLSKKTGETKRGGFFWSREFHEFYKVHSAFWIVFGPKVLLQKSLLSKKNPQRNPLTKITNYTTNPRETNEALQFPSWWGHSHHLDYHPKSWDPPTSKRAHVIGGQLWKVMEGPTSLNLDSWNGMLGSLHGMLGIPHHPMYFVVFFWRCFFVCFVRIEEIVVHFFVGEGGFSRLQHVAEIFD